MYRMFNLNGITFALIGLIVKFYQIHSYYICVFSFFLQNFLILIKLFSFLAEIHKSDISAKRFLRYFARDKSRFDGDNSFPANCCR